MSIASASMLFASRTRQPTIITSAAAAAAARRWAHSVRLIVTKDLPDGQTYEGDVVNVKAGYARNYLIPQKFAVYATRENFKKLDMKDPDMETVEERRLRLEREAQAGEDRDLKAADLLKHYLRNKVVCAKHGLKSHGSLDGCDADITCDAFTPSFLFYA